MWDDQPPMAFGDEIYQRIRGFRTPHLNTLAEEGIIVARMYTENGYTPSRSASLTGQHPVRDDDLHYDRHGSTGRDAKRGVRVEVQHR